jgi:hypothetical protein
MRRMGLFDYWSKYGPPDHCELRNGKLICNLISRLDDQLFSTTGSAQSGHNLNKIAIRLADIPVSDYPKRVMRTTFFN